jgi:dimethylargininase
MKFTQAIVRTPGKSLVRGITTANLGPPGYKRSLEQHAGYIRALQDYGLQVRVLGADEDHPDSTFLEDVALLTPHCAILLNPGAPSRKGETKGMDRILAEYYGSVHHIQDPGSVEGGDILQVESHYYIGLTERTNQAGADQVIRILESYGLTGSMVPVKDTLHLKSGIAYLGDNTIAVSGEFLDHQLFQGFTILGVPPDETYAANCLWINGTVLLPAGFPKTAAVIQEAGYSIRSVEVSEFQKLDGGLSCLSLRF